MNKLLKFEFHKLKKQKSFYICTFIMLLSSFISLFLSKSFPSDDVISSGEILLFAVSFSNFTMLCGIFISLFVCADYSEETVKNIYSHGFSRSKIYFSKLITVIFSTAVMFLLTLVFNYFLGNYMFTGKSENGNYILLLFGQFLICLAYSAFSFFVSISVKKSGTAIALSILGPSIVDMVISLIDAVLKTGKNELSNFWMESFSTSLSSLATDIKRIYFCIAMSLVYFAAFIIGGYFINRKHEV